MAKKKILEEDISVMEAVDTLSSIADVDPEELTFEQGADRPQVMKLLRARGNGDQLETVRQSFKAVHNYLKKVYTRADAKANDEDIQKGIHAIMVLAGEAVEKIDKCSSLFAKAHGKEHTLKESKEYQDLKKFYHNKLIKKFQSALESEDAWLAEWTGEQDVKDIEKLGLKDLETVKKDREYELFYLEDDDGNPFFTKNLLRHIKLVSDFDEIAFTDSDIDPLLKVKTVQDRDAHETAKEILEAIHSETTHFYRDALKFKEHQIVCFTNMAVMALRMAASERNLMKQAKGKTCLQYFYDFLTYLRSAFAETSYQKLVEMDSGERDRLLTDTIYLLHSICEAYFSRTGASEDLGAFVYQLVHTVDEEHAPVQHNGDFLTFLNHLVECHEDLEDVLRKYPNGPLFKVLDVFRDRESFHGFDPLLQENLPSRLFNITNKHYSTEVIRIPCPTKQEKMDVAYVAEEFVGFLRAINEQKKASRTLLFNYQDRTNWKEIARCKAIETLQSSAEFAKSVTVVTMPKNTDFYAQLDEYMREGDAKNFTTALMAQIEGGEECGFSFPKAMGKKDLHSFSKKLIALIHTHFFDDKETLSRKNRLDFIELFYNFLQLKIMEVVKPSYTSYMCKDTLDTGAAATAAMYGFAKLTGKDTVFSDEDVDKMFWILYAPALFVRERPIDFNRLSRCVSALTLIHTTYEQKGSELKKAFDPLFEASTFSTLHVND